MTALSIETSYSCSTATEEDDYEKHRHSPHAVLPFIRTHDLVLRGGGDCRHNSNAQLTPLDEGTGTGAILRALVAISLAEASGESDRWIPVGGTDKILKHRAKQAQKGRPETGGARGPWAGAPRGAEVFVWSATCDRPGYGADYPVVRSRGLVRASAHDVVDLIVDSERVTEYNKYSRGRRDLVVLTPDADLHSLENTCPRLGVPGEAKIFVSTSQPPLVRKSIEFKQLFYAQRLNSDDGVELDGVAYIAFGRSVWESPDGTTDGSDSDNGTTRCEVMLTVSLIREITTEDGEVWCELTNIAHGISPGVPIFIGKKLGLVAAEEYIKNIRAYFEKK